MKITLRLVTVSIFALSAWSAFAQNGNRGLIKPAVKPTSFNERVVVDPNQAPKALLCVDTLRYAQMKETYLGTDNFYTFELWADDNEAMSQTYLNATSHNITGVEIFGRKSPDDLAASLTLRASIYTVNASNTPTTLVGSGTMLITDTFFNYRRIVFASPLVVTGNYAVVVDLTSNGSIFDIFLNDAAPSQAYDEGLARAKSSFYAGSNGAWVSIPTITQTFTGGPFDFEPIVAPIINYNINTNFTINPSPACANQAITFTNTTTPAALIANRMYNFQSFRTYFQSVPDSTYAWNMTGAQPFVWANSHTYTYPTSGSKTPTLYTVGGFWASCVDNKATPITLGVLPANPGAITGAVNICGSGSQTYTIAPVAGATSYTWTLPSGWTGSSTSNSITVNVGASGGTISVVANSSCGSSAASTLNVNVSAENATFTYPSNTICVGSSNPIPTVSSPGTFSASGTGLVFVSTSTGEINMTSSSPGTYTVTYTTSGACALTSNQTIVITNSPSAVFSYATASYCNNSANELPVFGPGAGSGLFSATPAGLSINASTGEINFALSSVGTYTVSNAIAASGSCPSSSHNFTVTVHAIPSVSVSASLTTICENDSSVLTAGGGSNYSWSPLSGLSAGTGAIVVAKPTSDITYTVTGTDANGCSNTASIQITVNPAPAVSLTPYGLVCVYADDFTLTGGSPAGGSYTLDGVASTSVSPSGLGLGTYEVAYAYTDGLGCTGVASQNLVVDACLGLEDMAKEFNFTVSPNPASDFVWISFNFEQGKELNLNLISVDGKSVYTQSIITQSNNSIQIPVSQLASGVYYLSVGNATHNFGQKIVVQ